MANGWSSVPIASRGQAMAVNEETGDIVQVTESGYAGMLCLADHSMNLYFLRNPGTLLADASAPPQRAGPRFQPQRQEPARRTSRHKSSASIWASWFCRLLWRKTPKQCPNTSIFAGPCRSSWARSVTWPWINGKLRLFPGGQQRGGCQTPDARHQDRVGIWPPQNGRRATGLASMNLKTGEVKFIVAVPFQIGHVQTNPYVPGEIVFCWETGGKSPQRTWTVLSDGTGLRPLYPEAHYEWVTHEAVITKDEVAIAIMGHRKVGVNDEWGISGTREHPTGLGIVNLRYARNENRGQNENGQRPLARERLARWTLGGGRRFCAHLYLIDRHTDEMILLTPVTNPPRPTIPIRLLAPTAQGLRSVGRCSPATIDR